MRREAGRFTPKLILSLCFFASALCLQGRALDQAQDATELMNEKIEKARHTLILTLASGVRKDHDTARSAFVSALLEKYGRGDKVEPVIANFQAWWIRVSQLMTEWNPIGFKRSKVLMLLGKPNQDTNLLLEFSCASEAGGAGFRFTMLKDDVVGIQYVPGA